MAPSFLLTVLFILFNQAMDTWSCPEKCFCRYNTMDCSDQDLQVIPEGIPNVTYLNLEQNDLTSLQRSDFRTYITLKKLVLRRNKIQTINANTFYRLKTLAELDLSENLLDQLEVRTFSRMPMLTMLKLSYNEIQDIDRVVINLKSLIRLDLSNNHVAKLKQNAFLNLPQLRYVVLSDNNISSIDSKSFGAISQMSYLDIKNNPMVNIDGIFRSNPLLTYLDLTNCQLLSFLSSLPNKIRYLQMGRNNITALTKRQLSPYIYLQILVLDNNQIQNIENGTFLHMDRLIELWLSNNQLSQIPYLPSNIRIFHVSNNQITKLDINAFPMQSNVEELYIQGNLIRTLDQDSFRNLLKLRKLNIGGNEIKVFQTNVFSKLRSLEFLSLDMNDFHTMEKGVFSGLGSSLLHLSLSRILTTMDAIQGNVFQNLTYLRTLDVQESPSIADQILNSKEMTASLSKIEELNLMDNNIATLKKDFKQNFPLLAVLKISGNPFHCDKRLVWLKQWIALDIDLFYTPDYIECYSPPSLYGQLIVDLPIDDFAPTTLPPFYLTTMRITRKTTRKENNSYTIASTTENDGNVTAKPMSQNEGDGYSEKTYYIAIAVIIPCVTITLIALTVAYFIYKRRKSSVFYGDFVCNLTNGMTVPLPPPARLTRQDRSSVTSQPGEDITNNGVSKMKVYTWDN